MASELLVACVVMSPRQVQRSGGGVVFCGGGVVFCTVTVNEPVAVLWWASVVVQVTVVVPTGNVPDAGLQLTGTEPSTRSVAVAV